MFSSVHQDIIIKYYNRPFYIDFPLLSVVIYTQISNDYKYFLPLSFPAIRQDIQTAKTTETLSSLHTGAMQYSTVQ